MRTCIRTLWTAAVIIFGLWVTTPQAKADLGGNDLTVMQALATQYGWAHALGWNTANNPCPTAGIANWAGITCNRNGRVTIIVATCGNVLINQPLPPILSQLTALTSFDLRNCAVYGAIPDAWQTMTQLTRLRLDSNVLSGQIPSWLADAAQFGLFGTGLEPFHRAHSSVSE